MSQLDISGLVQADSCWSQQAPTILTQINSQQRFLALLGDLLASNNPIVKSRTSQSDKQCEKKKKKRYQGEQNNKQKNLANH